MSRKVVSRAGKVIGKYKNCFKVEKDTDGSDEYNEFEEEFNESEILTNEQQLLILFNSDDKLTAKQK